MQRLGRIVAQVRVAKPASLSLSRSFSSTTKFIQASLHENGCGTIHLNRPKSLNALNIEMVQSILATLKEWQEDSRVNFILFTGAGEKSFCSGGDVIALAQIKEPNPAFPQNFFRVEYTMNHLIAAYPKPIVSVMKGIVMGGGVGISLNGTYRVLTDSTKFAMPETGIGLFPDVGGSYLLPRLAAGPAVGMYFALTGQVFGMADSMYAGVGTHYVPETKMARLIATLEGTELLSPEPALASLAEDPRPSKIAAKFHDEINQTFDPALSVEQMLARLSALEADESVPEETAAWATDTLAILSTKSPTSLAITHRALRHGAESTLREVLQTDFRLAMRITTQGPQGDFYKGVHKQLVLKQRGATDWNPAPGSVPLKAYFAPFSKEENIAELDVDAEPVLV